MKITEGLIHLAVRTELKKQGWKLIAGQFPGGSDDECCALNIMDPNLARDCSPDPRRHSDNKLVPDLVALLGRNLLIIEMKPTYSAADLQKLRLIQTDRKADLLSALTVFASQKNYIDILPVETLNVIPGLGFSASSDFPREHDVCYFLVSSLDLVEIILPVLNDGNQT